MTDEPISPISPETRRYLEAALAACRRAGEIHRQHFRSAALRVELKKDASPVTVADRGSEEAIRETLHRAIPELGLLGEEFGQEGSERDRWIIDPIDATKNFVAGLPFFATLIGLELGGELVLGVVHAPVLGPGSGLFAEGDPAALGETWWAARGQGAWGGTGTTLATT
ncbi:MAG TPA: inositol monophosphatase family protein, partial [Thermoanaerobaculia bacterium]